MVAQDSLVVPAVLVQQLLSRGYRMIEAGDGEQTLAACHRERPDVVLLDVEMPHLDGHAVLTRIKADPRLADIPVVFVTSRVTDDVVEGLRPGRPRPPAQAVRAERAAGPASTRPCSTALQDELRLRNAELELASRWEGLLRRADTGLYAAKQGGRDRVVADPAAGTRPFTPEGQDAARYR